MQQMDSVTVQGVAPWMIWIWVFVGVALCAVIATVYKVVQIVREEKKNRVAEIERIAQAAIQAKTEKLANEISDKVMKAMEDKFQEIDAKLNHDKKELDEHDQTLDRITRTLESVDANIRDMREGFTCLARGTIASLNHQMHNGNGDEMERAARELNDYLTARPISRMK